LIGCFPNLHCCRPFTCLFVSLHVNEKMSCTVNKNTEKVKDKWLYCSHQFMCNLSNWFSSHFRAHLLLCPVSCILVASFLYNKFQAYQLLCMEHGTIILKKISTWKSSSVHTCFISQAQSSGETWVGLGFLLWCKQWRR
jgi:hypothetical protein